MGEEFTLSKVSVWKNVSANRKRAGHIAGHVATGLSSHLHKDKTPI
tara:strand:- start:362 stop:499 length:138 start_codon:yes stop_codon:yes gene_type:complete